MKTRKRILSIVLTIATLLSSGLECLDKAGRHREAFEFHKKARVLKPLHQAVIGNEKYFRDVWGME